MRRARLSRALGWASLGIGLTELCFAEDLGRVLGGSRRRSGLFKALGLRELASGWALLRQPHRPEWVWARVAGDAMDLALLAMTFREPRASRLWRGVITAAVAGATLVDLVAAVQQGVPGKRTDAPPLDLALVPDVPHESWRGSGLAEDMGSSTERAEELPEETRQQMMEDAARKLGLPPVH